MNEVCPHGIQYVARLPSGKFTCESIGERDEEKGEKKIVMTVEAERFFRASRAMFEHIEKCSPRYTLEDGYHWRTGDPKCFNKGEHDRLRHEETAAWRAYQNSRKP